MHVLLQKSEIGRHELRQPIFPLTRTARNLLFALDETRSADEWLGLVKGASKSDLRSLLSLGLVEVYIPLPRHTSHGGNTTFSGSTTLGGSPSFSSSSTMGATTQGGSSLGEPTTQRPNLNDGPRADPAAAGYDALHGRLAKAGRAHLGRVRNVKFVLDMDRCDDLDSLTRLARDLVTRVRVEQGVVAATLLERQLGLQAQARGR